MHSRLSYPARRAAMGAAQRSRNAVLTLAATLFRANIADQDGDYGRPYTLRARARSARLIPRRRGEALPSQRLAYRDAARDREISFTIFAMDRDGSDDDDDDCRNASRKSRNYGPLRAATRGCANKAIGRRVRRPRTRSEIYTE